MPIDPEFEKAMQRNPHLREYIQKFEKETRTVPEFVIQLPKKLAEFPNLLLPVGDPIFIHLHGVQKEASIYYIAIEPVLGEVEEEKYKQIMDIILEKAPYEPVPKNEAELSMQIHKLYDECVVVGKGGDIDEKKGMMGFGGEEAKVPLTNVQYDQILYYIERDIIGSGPIEPVIRDPYLEDISSIGVSNIYIIHKKFGTLKTNLTFGTHERLDAWMRSMSERIGRPVSESAPIADGALPDGSRINIIYSEDISIEGSSFTMRKFAEETISVIQLINWGALDCDMAAYIWLCLENGMSIFFSGETASGKTTLLNACLPFIKKDAKIFSIEDTPEVMPPHKVWQRLITRESGPEESRVDTFKLLKAALRSRPNYIIVGEIRGAEGATAFQAMQCIRDGYVQLANGDIQNIKSLFNKLSKHFGVENDSTGKQWCVMPPDRSLLLPSKYADEIDMQNEPISAIFKMPKTRLIHVEFDNGESIDVSPKHSFIVDGMSMSAAEILERMDSGDSNIHIELPESVPVTGIELDLFKLIDNTNKKPSALKNDDINALLRDLKQTYTNSVSTIYEKTGIDKTHIRNSLSKSSKTIHWDVLRCIHELLGIAFPDSIDVKFQGSRSTATINRTLQKSELEFLALYSLFGLRKMYHKIMLQEFNVEMGEKIRQYLSSFGPVTTSKGNVSVSSVYLGYLLDVLVSSDNYGGTNDRTGNINNYMPDKYRYNVAGHNASYNNYRIPSSIMRCSNEYLEPFISIIAKCVGRGVQCKNSLVPYISSILLRTGIAIKCTPGEKTGYTRIMLNDSKTARITKVEWTDEDYTYDVSFNKDRTDPRYFIAGNNVMGYQSNTGHPVLATFHASAVTKMIQRLTGNPINVPVTFIDNLNCALILQAVYRQGQFLRRCLAVEEIEGYYEDAGGVVTRAVFQWDPETDTHKFRGLNNSFLLEDKIATIQGYEDPRMIYKELFLRSRILQEMKNKGIDGYDDVFEIITNFVAHGVDGLPFAV